MFYNGMRVWIVYLRIKITEIMNEIEKEQLRMEIQHIFDSGANEIRVFEMVKSFIESRNGINKLPIHIVSTRTFNEDCELYIDNETDEWVLKHKGVIKKRAKSKLECLLTKKAIQKELGV